MPYRFVITGGSGFIGTNLVEHFLQRDGVTLVNVDVKPPVLEAHQSFWVEGDVLDAETLRRIFSDHQPTHAVHLAARTDTDAQDLADYRVNTDGTDNVLAAIQQTKSIERVVITSTQFVCGPGKHPEHDEDFRPHTVYGQSKVITEQLTRNADLDAIWTIIRPTNIWGPWHPRYPFEFWRVLKKGWYIHPGREPVLRCYGYVKNVVAQIEQILHAPPEQVHQKVYYVGDRPIELLDWVHGFSRAITGRDARIVPRGVVRSLAWVGDVLSWLGLDLPIHSSRYRSMTQNYTTPMEPTFEVFGDPPYNLEEGIQETVAWLREEELL